MALLPRMKSDAILRDPLVPKDQAITTYPFQRTVNTSEPSGDVVSVLSIWCLQQLAQSGSSMTGREPFTTKAFIIPSWTEGCPSDCQRPPSKAWHANLFPISRSPAGPWIQSVPQLLLLPSTLANSHASTLTPWYSRTWKESIGKSWSFYGII